MNRLTATAALSLLALAPLAAGQTPSDTCADAPVFWTGLYNFDTRGATPGGDSECGVSGGSKDLWFQYLPYRDGNAILSTCGSSFDTVLSAFSACGGAELACNDDYCGLQSRIIVPVVAGQAIFVRVAGSGDAAGMGVLELHDPDVPPLGTWRESLDGGGDAGDLPSNAQDVPEGVGEMPRLLGFYNGLDADVYEITICDPVNFSATTVNEETAVDTQLWLFTPDGHGVVYNDDNTIPGTGSQSNLTPQLVQSLPPGRYLLAVSGYNRDPVDASNRFLWRDSPYRSERGPDGTGRFNPVAEWVGSNFVSGPYRVDLTGVCRGGICPWTPVNCVADYNGSGGTPDDADVDAFFQAWNQGDECTDANRSGGTPDDADVYWFFLLWNNGGC